MKKHILCQFALWGILMLGSPSASWGWHDEIHLGMAKAAGYKKWFNAAAADIIKVKAHKVESSNHFVNNPAGTKVDSKMVLRQAKSYNTDEDKGHLYGAIIGSFRDYAAERKAGKYGEYHMAFCAHYIGDLSQPLHNIVYSPYNKKYHLQTDGILRDEVLKKPGTIRIYPISIRSEADLAKEIARIANISIKMGYLLEKENRLITRSEAYECLSHSTSLLKAVLDYAESLKSVKRER